MSRTVNKIRVNRTSVIANRLRALVATCATALALLSLYPLAASASVSWIVHGRGFGHGVGMSAYGAYGYAQHGKGYRFILGHYYTGTSLGTIAGTRVVRVLLGIETGDVGFSGATSACGIRLDPRRSYQAHRDGNMVKLRSSGGKRLASCGRKLRAAGPGRVSVGGYGAYRGALETVPTESQAGSLNVINALALEHYVKGVMPNEVPPSWPSEELKAQAVAVRSIALTGDVGGNGFDLYSDTRSQVYKGLESEYARSNDAVAATRGQVVMYGGKVAQTLYSACSGGHTESAVNVFGSPVPYLVGVPDPYDSACPLHEWTLRFSGPEISAKLGSYLRGRLKKVVVTKRGASPRIIEAKLYGTGGVSTVTGTDLEVALGGYDTWMTFQKVVSGK
ncbi:MAG TPA: SpoIID/LytB domain-containing protein [Solirubrobacterales bacterium]|jgi:stage II sporulation protein D|nr:SpoIID/LytB domain-containing protein [Solirubrobacterales bacterium]